MNLMRIGYGYHNVIILSFILQSYCQVLQYKNVRILKYMANNTSIQIFNFVI